jgi:hypothetical protein
VHHAAAGRDQRGGGEALEPHVGSRVRPC